MKRTTQVSTFSASLRREQSRKAKCAPRADKPGLPFNEILSERLHAGEVLATGLLSRGVKWLTARRMVRARAWRLRVCATIPLGEKRFVSIIECDGRQFLIGSSTGSVTLLAQLGSEDDPSATTLPVVSAEDAR